ncbi:MAG: phosphopantothenoylcysteine decarboxylase [Candidatus Omnitrophica bacterium]|nr:phosphopantothenoylcysteine decarboxylase [Candidatus Omnitrophota bacterium]
MTKSGNLKNKRILITAGPTWVAIDSVRVISNTATGETGILLAEEFSRLGAKVTLVLGPIGRICLSKNIRLINFRFFDELKDIIVKELRSHRYDAMIHSAAVSDYAPQKLYRTKIGSGLKKLALSLKSTPKIIDLIKQIRPDIFLVGFKFEPQSGKQRLIKEAKDLILSSGADLVVANTLQRNKYKSFISDGVRVYIEAENKRVLVAKLSGLVKEKLLWN